MFVIFLPIWSSTVAIVVLPVVLDNLICGITYTIIEMNMVMMFITLKILKRACAYIITLWCKYT